MAIEMKGRLDSESLDRIFAVLTEDNVACSFLISDGVSEKIFYFSIGGIRQVSLGGRKGVPIGDILVSEEKITPEQRERILEFAAGHDKRFGEAAVAMGLVPKEEIEAAVRYQMEAEICDLELWTEAEYEFEEGQPPNQFYDSQYRACSVSCDVPEFVKSVQRRRTQVLSITKRITSDRLIFETTEAGEKRKMEAGDDAVSLVLKHVNGKRRIREIIEESGFTALFVFEALHRLGDDGFVKKSGGGEHDLQGREEIIEEIRRLEQARSEVMGDIIVRTRLARAYEQVNETAKAAKIWKEIARIHRRKNDLKKCLAALTNAIRCTPEDFNSREQMLDIYRANKENGKVLSEGRVLADMLFKHNLLNRARNLLGTLVNLAPQDARVRRIYALTLLGLGDEKGALKQLKELAKILENVGGRVSELKEVYRRILALDRGNREIRKKLLIATGGQKVIWITRAIFGAAAVILLVAGAVYLYESSARHRFAKGFDVERLLRDHRFEEARVKIRDFQDRYRFSTVGRNAAEFLNRIDQREAAYLRTGIQMEMREAEKAEERGAYREAREVYERIAKHDAEKSDLVAKARDKAARYANAEREAQRLVRKGGALTGQGKHPSAYRVYREVRTMYPATEAVQRIRYPLEVRTIPESGTVFLNGVEVGTAPVLLHYSLATKTRITIEKHGFEQEVLIVEEILPYQRQFTLQKKVEWVFAGLGPIEANPVVANGTLYVTCRDRNLYAISTDDGQLQFELSLGIFGDTRASVAVANEVVAVGTGRGEVIGVDAVNGQVLWRRQIGPAISADLTASPDGHMFLVTQDEGEIFALTPSTGEVIWNEDVAATPGTGVDVAGSLVYVGSYDNRQLTVLQVEDGSAAWQAGLPGPTATRPVVSGTYALLGSDDFNVYVVDVFSKKRIARLPTRGMVKARPTVIARDVYFGSMDGAFYCYGLRGEGGMKWRRPLGAAIIGEATVGRANLYVGVTNGTLYCLSRATGKTVWMFQTGGKIVSRPILVNGMIFVTSMDGKVYAMKE